jgi:exodeoxyribonuclease VII small subunit
MMTKPNLEDLTYEEKEKRLEEILERLDRSETPMDELASDAREASQLIKSMRATLKSAQAEIVQVLDELHESGGESENLSVD